MGECKATYWQDGDLSCVYVYVVPENEFPAASDGARRLVVSELRETEIILDYHTETGQLLGIEVLTKTAKKPEYSPITA